MFAKFRTVLHPGEQVLMSVRAHWIVLNKPMNVLGLHLVAAFYGSMLFPKYFLHIAGSCLFSVLYFVYAVLERNRNIWLVTDQRVVDESGVFSLYSKESPLNRINNISYSQSLLGRLLGYGTVTIQTAAEYGETVYRYVDNPRLLRDTITNAIHGVFEMPASRNEDHPLAAKPEEHWIIPERQG
ncbi:PH domain-containing protein [Desulfacinum hydrothermale]|nr:PH domain-containing protein [Desulfacinum hydrothermale]